MQQSYGTYWHLRRIGLKRLKAIGKANIAFALTTSGEFVFVGARTAPKMLRLLTTIEAREMNKMRAIHPGEILREEFMMPLGLSAHALAVALRVAAPRINDIVREKRGITPDTALRLARYFNSTPQFWLNLQTSYDLKTAQLTSWPKIEREVLPHAA